MQVLYDINTRKVLNIGDKITREGEYFIVHKNKTKVKYPASGLGAIILHNDSIKIEKGIPSIYDEKLGMVYSDPDYTGIEVEPEVEEETDTPITEETPVEKIKKPMSIAEMREKIKWLEETVNHMLESHGGR